MKFSRTTIATLVFFACSLVIAALLPPMQDEAYYSVWGENPQWGYFDHPPVVAWMAFLSRQLAQLLGLPSHSPAAFRLISGVLGAGLFLVMVSLCRIVAPVSTPSRILFSLVGGCLGILAASVLLTPDVGLMFFCAAAFHESLHALKGRLMRWCTAGIFLACACLAKYTAGLIIIGPIFLLIRHWQTLKPFARIHLPYVLGGVLLFFLTFLPHLTWLAQHDWVSLKVQLNHGFTGKVEESSPKAIGLTQNSAAAPSSENFCPAILDFDKNSTAALWGGDFLRMQDALDEAAGRKPLAPKIELPPWLKILNRQAEVLGACLAVWGTLLLPLALRMVQMRRRRKKTFLQEKELQPVYFRRYCGATALGCIVFFSVTAVFAKVEANWPLLYIIGATPWLAIWLTTGSLENPNKQWRPLAWAAAANVGIILIYLLRPPFFPSRWYVRIDKEHHGLSDLANFLKQNPNVPTLIDNYQLLAQMYRMGSATSLGQWQALNRSSEFTRSGQELLPLCQPTFLEIPSFRYVGSEPPPEASGFKLTALTQVRDCLGIPVEILKHADIISTPNFRPRCDDPLHAWYIATYSRL